MKINEIAFACYPVTDLKRARKFYETTLGLKTATTFGDDNQGWIEYDIGAGTLAITNFSSDWKPSADGGSVGLEVESFESAISELKSAGTKFRVEAMETPVCFNGRRLRSRRQLRLHSQTQRKTGTQGLSLGE